MSPARVVLLAVLFGGCSSDPPAIRDLLPVMSVSPDALDFGGVGVLHSGEGTIYIQNDGLGDLTVTPSFEGPPVFAMDLAEELSIPPGEEVLATVTFTPETYQTYTGRAILESDDEEHPRWVVPVTGEGVDLPTPDIEIPEPSLRLETAPGQSSVSGTFAIQNVGAAPLVIDLIGLTADSDPELSLSTILPAGLSVPPGSEVLVGVTYEDPTEEGHNATVIIQTNDPDEPETMILLIGNDGGDLPKPEAVIDCPSEVLLAGPEWVHLSGAQSSDPAGGALSYRWEVTARPDASDDGVPLDPDNTEEVDLYVDVAGTWQVSLTVESSLGVESDPALCTFDARPEDAIHIELSWDALDSDLDLHLTQGGSSLFDIPEDCYYCNKTPDWGANGSDDDPRLDIDYTAGGGPENINLFAPEDGTYDVSVHYFGGPDVAIATVEVWLDGVSVHVEDRVMVKDEVWTVGQIAWPEAILTNTGAPNSEASVHACPP